MGRTRFCRAEHRPSFSKSIHGIILTIAAKYKYGNGDHSIRNYKTHITLYLWQPKIWLFTRRVSYEGTSKELVKLLVVGGESKEPNQYRGENYVCKRYQN